MFFLGMGMPDAERRAVAEHIAGKPLGEEQLKATATNMCPQAPGEFSVSDSDPHWNGWGQVWQTRAFSQPKKQD
jgi:hypothetical protein